MEHTSLILQLLVQAGYNYIAKDSKPRQLNPPWAFKAKPYLHTRICRGIPLIQYLSATLMSPEPADYVLLPIDFIPQIKPGECVTLDQARILHITGGKRND